MTSESRNKALDLLAEAWALSPDVRLGQLMAHLGLLGEAHLDHGLGDLEDDELMAVLERHKLELESRATGEAAPVLPPTGNGISASGSPIGYQPVSP